MYCEVCNKANLTPDDYDCVATGVHYVCGNKVEEVCAHCLGTGEVSIMDYVYPGEPHMAPIGTKRCICQIKDND